MEILFTTSNTVMSKVIRAVTNEPVSHCAILSGSWVIHSNLYGVKVELLSTFMKKNNIIYTKDVPYSTDKLMTTLSKYGGSMYDLGALLYLGVRYFLPFLPKKNLWQCTNMYLCTEWVTEVIGDVQDSEITPYQLYLWLKSKEGEYK